MNIIKLLLNVYFGDNDSVLVLGDFCEENNVYFQGLVNADVEESLCINHDDYYRTGDNYDSGNGNGYGNGDGYGGGDNDGNGDDYGNGHGNGYGIKKFYI